MPAGSYGRGHLRELLAGGERARVRAARRGDLLRGHRQRVVAGREMAAGVLDERRLDGAAQLGRARAARVEATARRRRDRVGRLALELRARAAAVLARVGDRDRRRAAPRCRGGSACRRAPAAGESSTILPRYITAIRSETWRTTERSWATNTNVSRSSSWSASSRLMTCAWIETSSAETGSSSMISFGSRASARAIPIRWRWPPENSCGKRSRCSGFRPTRESSSRELLLEPRRATPASAQRRGEDLAHALARVQRRLRVLEDHLHLPADRQHRAPRGLA